MAAKKTDTDQVIRKFELAVKSYWKGDYEKALAAFQKIRDGSPDDMTMMDRINSFIAACEQRLQIQPDKPKDAEEQYLAGIIHLNNDEPEKSIRHFTNAIKKDNKNDAWIFSLACAYARNGQEEEAISALEKAIRINRDNRVYARNCADFKKLQSVDKFKRIVGESRRAR